MAERLESRLLARVRQVLADQPVTEAELRALVEQADAWARSLRGQVEASERRLDALIADEQSPLGELAAELRRVEQLLPALSEAYALRARLETRARELRTLWLLQQTTARPLIAAPETARQDDRLMPGL